MELIPLVLILVVFWLILIRPQRQRQKKHQQMVSNLVIGDDVVTIGGMHGTVVALTDETMDLEVTDDVVLRFTRQSLARIVKDEPEVQ